MRTKINFKIAVVIPCYKVKNKILNVLKKIDLKVDHIYLVDDACPDATGKYVANHFTDRRLKIIFHATNKGVGASVISGYKAALEDKCDLIVKIDGDGQMDPSKISNFIEPIINGHADYTKGNRFYDLEKIMQMPKMRLFGNSLLSFITKLSSGYWNVFDPTNGYTAIHSNVLKKIRFDKLEKRFFFESDLLFRLNINRAVVVDIPMHSNYQDYQSNLKINQIILEFGYKHIRNFLKRIFYNYYLRNLSVASFELPLGLILLSFGLSFGVNNWIYSLYHGISTPVGTVVLSALSITLGVQFLMGFLSEDILMVPRIVQHKLLKDW